MNILFTGGGTGGHLYPALAIADEVVRQRPGTEIIFVGSTRGLEAEVVPGRGYRLETIEVRGFRRRLSADTFRSLWLYFAAARKVKRIIRELRPAAAVGTGGYVSAPVMRAAHGQGVPCLIQEQNSYPGLATRWLAPKMDEIHLNFEEAGQYLRADKAKMKLTGNPVVINLDAVSREEACERFGLAPGKKTVLIIGGSQGARSINNALAAALPGLLEAGLQVLWAAGKNNYETVTGQVTAHHAVKILPYIKDMSAAYRTADLVIARAGAMTLAELGMAGLPSVLVPLPIATEDHQRKNAEAVVRAGGARMILDRDLNGAVLEGMVRELAGDDEALNRMGTAVTGTVKTGAAAEIASRVLALARNEN